MPIQLDRSRLPLLRIVYLGEYTDTELAQFLSELEAVLTLPGRKVGLIDLSKAVVSSATQRQQHGEWIARHEQQLRAQFSAAALVCDNPLIRGGITAVFWIRPLPLPSHVAANVQQAEHWLAPYLADIAGRRV